jgi:hypothetical protein
VSADGPSVIDTIHADPVRRDLGWVPHGFSRGGREYGWNRRPNRLAVVERMVLGGLAERAHSYGCPVHLTIPTAQEQWHTVSATRPSITPWRGSDTSGGRYHGLRSARGYSQTCRSGLDGGR